MYNLLVFEVDGSLGNEAWPDVVEIMDQSLKN